MVTQWSKQRFIRALAALGAVLVLAFSSGVFAQQVTITLMGGTQENIREMLPVFHEMYPHINVEYRPILEGDHNEQVLLQIAAGTSPDVFLLDIPYVQVFHERDLLYDLRDLATRHDVPLDMYPEYVLDIFTREGKTYALPKGFTPVVTFYNRQMFAERGVAEPTRRWTWNDHVEIARKLTVDRTGDGQPDVYGTLFSTWVGYVIPMMWSWGTDFLSPDGSTASGYVNSVRTAEFFEFIQDWQTSGIAPPPGVPGSLSAGSVAMTPSGHWGMFSLRERLDAGEFDLGVIHLPIGPYADDPTTVIYSTGWAISKDTQHLEEAILLMNFLAGPIYMRKEALETLVEIPGHSDLIRELLETDPYNVEDEFVYAAQFGRAPWTTRFAGFSNAEAEYLAPAVEAIWQGAAVGPELEKAALGLDTWLAEHAAGRR
mgnify:FL=1